MVSRYETYDDLLAYCELSANPVGRLVLAVTGTSSPERVRRSDAICTALQIVEHLQDVAEDFGRDRIYLPAEDMKRFHVQEADLATAGASASLRALVAYEAQRALDLLNEGAPWWVASPAGSDCCSRGSWRGKGGGPRDRRRPVRRPSRPAEARQAPAAARGGRDPARKGVIRTVESPPPASAPVLAAYSYCEAVTGQQARNFAYGIRLLPTPKRRAMSALYAFSRRVDDIGDGALAADVKVTRLEDTRTLLDRVRAGKVEEDDTDPVAVALSHAASAFPIPLGGLDELIDGVLMDVRGETYETWDDLKVYCRCVAGAIGRLSLGVFGTEAGARGTERAAEYADTLGLALQLTNILRDVREDAEGAAPTCRRTTWRSSAAPPGSTGPPRPRAPTSRASSTSRCAAPAPCSPRATGCCPCSTGAAGPAWPPWPASTAVCWTASSATPRPSCAAGSRCPAGRRPTSPCAACPAWTPGTSPAARPSGRQPGGGPDGRAGRRSGPGGPTGAARQATPRCGAASLRTSAGRAGCRQHDRQAGEDAR